MACTTSGLCRNADELHRSLMFLKELPPSIMAYSPADAGYEVDNGGKIRFRVCSERSAADTG